MKVQTWHNFGMPDRKLLFFDIDGTLWDAKNIIPDSTKEAFVKLRKQGHLTFICSGRSRGFIRHPDLFALGFDGVISGCATMIEYKDETIFYYEMNNKSVADTVNLVRSYGFKPILEGKRFLYLDDEEFGQDPYVNKLRADMGEFILPISSTWGKWEVSKLSCDTRNIDTRECYSILKKDFDLLIHNEDVVEVVPKGYDKSEGINRIVDFLGADHKDTIAFGDSVNDLGMLKKANIGVAMGNATEGVKAVSDYVTDAMKEDGIYKACEKFGLF